MLDLGTLGGDFSYATGVNTRGEIVGGAFLSGNRVEHAFLYSDGHMLDLGTLGGNTCSADGINNRVQIVGGSSLSGEAATHGFLYSGGQMLDLGTLGGNYSWANGINAPGEVVGTSTLVKGTEHAFIYSDGQMKDLNNLLVPNADWILIEATCINDAGQIAGWGWHNVQLTHAFLMTPVHWKSQGTTVAGDSTNTALGQSSAVLASPERRRIPPIAPGIQ
jgi:probable HAF family extracellular repeat protein